MSAFGDFFDTLKNQVGTTLTLSAANYLTGSKIDAPRTAVALNPNVIPTNQPANQVLAPVTTVTSDSDSFFAKHKYLIIGGGIAIGAVVLIFALKK